MSDSSDLNFGSQDAKIVAELDSLSFGTTRLPASDYAQKKSVVEKAIQYLDNYIIKTVAELEATVSDSVNLCESEKSLSEKDQTIYKQSKEKLEELIDHNIYCTLGHFHLLNEDYERALSAYQVHESKNPEAWKNSKFLFGLGICYFHFSLFRHASTTLQKVIYVDPGFSRANEVHFRLGIIFKFRKNFDVSLRHFRQALNDTSPATFDRADVRFHITHLFEVCGREKQAAIAYDKLAKAPNVSDRIRALCYLQLGWLSSVLHPSDNSLTGEVIEDAALESLNQSIRYNPQNGRAFYYLGRRQASRNRVHEAFTLYRNSIDKAEACADTWCSIGVLYQQQSQTLDALQAYVCAVQLERHHVSAWVNLGLLYESVQQLKDALTCYNHAIKVDKRNEVSRAIHERTALLEKELPKFSEAFQQSKARVLPAVEDAWTLPIPAELTQRQSNTSIASQLPGNSVGGAIASMASAPNTPMSGQPGNKQQPTAASTAPSATSSTNQNSLCMFGQGSDSLFNENEFDALFENEDMSLFDPSNLPGNLNLGNLGNFDHLLSADLDPTGSLTGPSQVGDVEMAEPLPEASPLAILTRPFLAPTHPVQRVHIGLSARQIVAHVKGFGKTSTGWSKSFLPGAIPAVPPVKPPGVLPREKLLPPTPTVYLDARKDAHLPELMRYCLQQPVAVIRGLAAALRLDLSLFSTKTLVDTNPEHRIEVRTQRQQLPDENRDTDGVSTWRCESAKSHTTIAKYANYQAASFQDALKMEKTRAQQGANGGKGRPGAANAATASVAPAFYGAAAAAASNKKKIIRFGTNCDLSDEKKWLPQLQELTKLPVFVRVVSASNMLSHIGHTVLGMNTVQLYMKVPGSRTPGHQENNNFCSVNVNIGPGDCEWFNVPEQYWGVVHDLCLRNQVDYLTGSWWPSLEELYAQGVPVYRLIQKPGDLVWINAGTVHWVQAIGWCNNIAWNVGPLTARQYQLGLDRYEFNRLHGVKSIVSMVHLSWMLARHLRISDRDLFELIKHTLARSLVHIQLQRDFLEHQEVELKWHGKKPGEAASACTACEIEVFDILLVTQGGQDRRFLIHCMDCARRISPQLKGFTVLEEYDLKELFQTYDSFVLQTHPIAAYSVGRS